RTLPRVQPTRKPVHVAGRARGGGCLWLGPVGLARGRGSLYRGLPNASPGVAQLQRKDQPMPAWAIVLICVVVVFLIVLWFVSIYNSMIRGRNETRNAWSQIDVQLKRRHDLIPNLVETVKGYASHEKQTLENVTRARSQAVGAQGVEAQARAESELTAALGRLMVVVEQYPDLKANQNFLALQEELTATENRIGFARQFYNDSVMQYNNKAETFPSNVIAGMFQFAKDAFFATEEPAARAGPRAQFYLSRAAMWEAIHRNTRRSQWIIGLMAGLLLGLGALLGRTLAGPEGMVWGVVAAAALWGALLAITLLGGEDLVLLTAGAREIRKDD